MPRYTESEARAAVASSQCYTEVLRRLGLRPAGGNHRVLRRYVDEIWGIPTDHFDPDAARRASGRLGHTIPLEHVLVQGSPYSRTKLKERLYAAGMKARRCELCGQDERWRGARISLILDHVNGVPDDNRLENLRIVCPNCAATLATHCGRKNRLEMAARACERCGRSFTPRQPRQRHCSRSCGVRHANRRRSPRPEARKVPRPSHAQLLADVASMSVLAVGRKYGVSDNAVRKWLRAYEAAGDAGRAGGDMPSG